MNDGAAKYLLGEERLTFLFLPSNQHRNCGVVLNSQSIQLKHDFLSYTIHTSGQQTCPYFRSTPQLAAPSFTLSFVPARSFFILRPVRHQVCRRLPRSLISTQLPVVTSELTLAAHRRAHHPARSALTAFSRLLSAFPGHYAVQRETNGRQRTVDNTPRRCCGGTGFDSVELVPVVELEFLSRILVYHIQGRNCD